MTTATPAKTDHHYILWLKLVAIAARGESFTPTPEEQVEVADLANLAGMTDDALAKMQSTAERFCQIQNLLAEYSGDEQAFTDCVQLVRDLNRELSTTTRKLKAQIQAAEARQHALANALLRGSALRKESEILQRAIALEGRR